MKVRFERDKDGKIITVPDDMGLFDMIEFDKVPKVTQKGFTSCIDPYDGSSIDKYLLDEVGQMPQIPFPHLIDEMKELSQYYNQNLMIEKKRAVLGIDPGKSGGLVVIYDEEVVFKSVMPISGDSLDIKGLFDAITALTRQYNLTVVLEEVHSIFGSSAGSNFTFGFVCGAIESVVISCGIKLIKVQPKKWQKELWATSDICYKPKKPAQKNASVDTKTSSLNCAKRLFPHIDFRKSNSPRVTKDHDGIVDACLLAEYGRIKNL